LPLCRHWDGKHPGQKYRRNGQTDVGSGDGVHNSDFLSWIERVRCSNSKETLSPLARKWQSLLRAIEIIGQWVEKKELRRVRHR
jgi:hypothetical protein